ncbi:hypothetical protein [Haloarcula salina]|uniref:Uncharacterized protein n=1 Tax=Haloarcula salina TaxID=1429914 RepID=A0AA41FYV9_9EURY|nr:hypothetical protein [Haloarcula salina]MBV0900529.1 hypothetical protein [Haloarcula salina]
MARPLAYAAVAFAASLATMLALMATTTLVAGGPLRAVVLAIAAGLGTYLAVRSGVLEP